MPGNKTVPTDKIKSGSTWDIINLNIQVDIFIGNLYLDLMEEVISGNHPQRVNK